MPCYLFSFHGYGTWMPDHRRGYVHRTQGLQPQDDEMAAVYRANQRFASVTFDAVMQEHLIGAARHAGVCLDATVHCVGTEPTHLHILLSWRHDRDWQAMRRSLRAGLTRAMNERFGKRPWFSQNSSRRKVKDRALRSPGGRIPAQPPRRVLG
jgi:hypothetical protein